MKVVRFESAESYEPEKNWRRVSLCNQSDISIEHFVKAPGHASPKHSHPNAQVLIVLKGKLEIWTAEGGAVILEEMDTAYIDGDQEHIVTNPLKDEVSVGLDIFVPGRSFDFWLKKKELLNNK
ncbi:MAG: hypothetical protein PWQ25_1198 [Deferribacteres bacterium]|jgi:quercetin dioxygenase-like cupin family protein|nr:hypothetical protein [Deferribacteraceae bacterium]MDK2792335.1 hypothetical protein [Deferribacteres bacterium]